MFLILAFVPGASSRLANQSSTATVLTSAIRQRSQRRMIQLFRYDCPLEAKRPVGYR